MAILNAASLAGALLAGPALETTLAAIAREAGGRVGVAAVLVETGEHAQLHGNEAFPMQTCARWE
jgi:hypothetical protein